jgi:hypothetical protein
MSLRKYISEFGLHMVGTFKLIAQQDDLGRAETIELLEQYPCHIYMVCRRPRVTQDPSLFEVDNETIRGRFLIQRANAFEPHEFTLPNPFGRTDLSLECPYPHTRFVVKTSEGTIRSHGKVGVLAQRTPSMSNLLALEVLYVGQAYGTDGSRTAADRLRSHSTLQEIYAAALGSAPDHDVWLILWHFEQILLASFDGTQQNYGTTDEEDDHHIKSVLAASVSEQQRINFTEAALIRYFEPEYNKTYKYSFPNPAHGTYRECYDIDLNAVSVEVATDDIGCQLWSPAVGPAWWHFPSYPLHSREERRSMFELLDPATS